MCSSEIKVSLICDMSVSDDRACLPVLRLSTMGDLSTSASSGIRPFQARVNLGSVVQALRYNSESTLLDVRPGSNWFFHHVRDVTRCRVPDENEQPDVMNQVVKVEVGIEEDNDRVEFDVVWDSGNLVSISLLEAMRTNKTVRSLALSVACLEEPHLAAIEESLNANATLQRFSVSADCAINCPRQAISEAFQRILEQNMCLRELDIGPLDALPVHMRFEDEGELAGSGAVPLGDTVGEAVDRNEQAWTVAKHLGQLNRASMDNCQHLGDVGFRHDLLLFFLEKGCQPPPQMFHILKGLPKGTRD